MSHVSRINDTATHCNTVHCNTLQHIATHCNTLQHTATHCNTLLHKATHFSIDWYCMSQVSHMNTHTCEQTSHCNTLQRTATHCDALEHTATRCNTHSWIRIFATKKHVQDSSRRYDVLIDMCNVTHRHDYWLIKQATPMKKWVTGGKQALSPRSSIFWSFCGLFLGQNSNFFVIILLENSSEDMRFSLGAERTGSVTKISEMYLWHVFIYLFIYLFIHLFIYLLFYSAGRFV